MSTVTFYGEGTRLTHLTGDQNRSYVRNPYGTEGVCRDYNNNATDFILTNPSDPQNSSSPYTLCPAPTATPEWERRILINEVAWGGTQADDILAQWIELRNPSMTDAIDLTGWYLQIPGKGSIPLSGSIGPNGYYLIERNEADTSAASSLVYAFPFLDVNGDRLFLYNSTHNLVDSANSNGGPWPAGNRFVDYASMERIGPPYGADIDSAWLTFNNTYRPASDRLGNPINGSPGEVNPSGGLVSTPTYTPTLTPTPTATFTPTPTLTPTLTTTPVALRSIIISEVAWMGTLADANDEWIELHNPGTTAINITGWTLSSTTGTPNITLAGTIEPGGYFLLERTDNLTVSDIAADQIYAGALSNEGMALRLRTASGQDIDTANGNGGPWPAGDADPARRCSMERRGANFADSDTAWITNTGTLRNGLDSGGGPICGTPRNANWAYIVTPTPSPVGPARTPTRTPTRTRIPAAAVSQVIINEFLPFPRSDWNNDGQIDSGDEFIELMNVGNVSINLQGWRLDDQQGDSTPYTLSEISLAPGAKVAFFASQTGILLSNRSDSVRLLMPNGSFSDAFTYITPPKPDQAWCRLPDGGPDWVFGCEPTPGLSNKLAETIFRGETNRPAICESPDLPVPVYLSECLPSGLEAWSRRLWDGLLPVFQLDAESLGRQHWFE